MKIFEVVNQPFTKTQQAKYFGRELLKNLGNTLIPGFGERITPEHPGRLSLKPEPRFGAMSKQQDQDIWAPIDYSKYDRPTVQRRPPSPIPAAAVAAPTPASTGRRSTQSRSRYSLAAPQDTSGQRSTQSRSRYNLTPTAQVQVAKLKSNQSVPFQGKLIGPNNKQYQQMVDYYRKLGVLD